MVAEVRVDACTAESVYRFIEEFEDSSFVNLNQLQRGDKEINGPQTRVILILDLVSPECSTCSQIITNTHAIPKTPDLDR